MSRITCIKKHRVSYLFISLIEVIIPGGKEESGLVNLKTQIHKDAGEQTNKSINSLQSKLKRSTDTI